jgi:hypothetical protein
MEAREMIRRIAHAFARACWAIGDGTWAIGDGISRLGDRINLIGVKRVPPSDFNKIVHETLEAQSEKIVSNVRSNNVLIDMKTSGSIDRRPSWWRQ